MKPPRPGVIQGTLDLLVLRTLLFKPVHGHGIAKHIQRTTDDVLQVDHGSLYPSLRRLEREALISSKWETNETGRELRMYRLTAKGRRRLVVEDSRWRQLARAMARMLGPV